MNLIKWTGALLAASMFQTAWASNDIRVEALDEQQLNEELPYLEALLDGELELSEAELFRRHGDRWRDRDGRRGRDGRWRRPPPRRPAPVSVACYARNIRTGYVYRAMGYAPDRFLQQQAMHACQRATRFDRHCRPMGCRRFR
jgi:hypothetical protein